MGDPNRMVCVLRLFRVSIRVQGLGFRVFRVF